ncbi:putative E3 ubiquitin-protein ligase UBR7 [Tigriopus californicus]|nr:putative E3 ubiquitin-protein ligase UBR7 [Tigriopus californicus]
MASSRSPSPSTPNPTPTPSSSRASASAASSTQADVVPAEESDSVTMMDVLHEEESLESDARAVLGAADAQNCTYHTGGYMTRQALYSCLTCLPAQNPDFQPAGICLACSYHCHEGHDLVELYTKRNFRCDCGNDTFGTEVKCKLAGDKTKTNSENKYNQNFKGVYCTCHRPYPDPEDPVEDEMIQCILCEDWYHGRHLELDTTPKDDSYSEMICVTCVRKYPFFMNFRGIAVQTVTPNDTDQSVDVEKDPNESSTSIPEDEKGDAKTQICFSSTKLLDTEPPRTLFMLGDWRQQVCSCKGCREKLAENHLEFVKDLEDTVHHYESQSEQKESSQYEDGMKALSEMDRVKQVEAIQSYNSMKSNLMDYLKKFAENGKVVRQEDIQEFFSGLKSSKRPRVEIPKFCR